jgi:hypothetical protein
MTHTDGKPAARLRPIRSVSSLTEIGAGRGSARDEGAADGEGSGAAGSKSVD